MKSVFLVVAFLFSLGFKYAEPFYHSFYRQKVRELSPQLWSQGDGHNREIPSWIQVDLLTKQEKSFPCSCELQLAISSKVTEIRKRKKREEKSSSNPRITSITDYSGF